MSMTVRKASLLALSKSGSMTYSRYTFFLNKLSTDARIFPAFTCQPSIQGKVYKVNPGPVTGYCSPRQLTVKPRWQHDHRCLSTKPSLNSKLPCVQLYCSSLKSMSNRKIAFEMATRQSGTSTFVDRVPARTCCTAAMCVDTEMHNYKVPRINTCLPVVSRTEHINKAAQHPVNDIKQLDNQYFRPFDKHLPCLQKCSDTLQTRSYHLPYLYKCSDTPQKRAYHTCVYNCSGGSSSKSMGYHSVALRTGHGRSSRNGSEQMMPFSTASRQGCGVNFCDNRGRVMVGCCQVRNCSTTGRAHTDGDDSTTRRAQTDGQTDGDDRTGIRTQPPWRILFFGTDQIAVETLKVLHENLKASADLVESIEVVTSSKQLPVRVFAETVGLDIQCWPIETVYNKYDVGILVSFGHLIPDTVINMFPYGILNMHPSLLPRWRGASPIIHTVLHGDSVTGVSVMDIRPRHFDIGPVLMQRTCPVPPRVTSFQLADHLGKLGASMVLECLRDLPTLERLEHEQDPQGVTYAHKISARNATIDWARQTAEEIDCQYRAIHELIPLRSEWRGQGMKLLDVVDPVLMKDIHPGNLRGYQGDITLAAPGTPALCKKTGCLVVKCKGGLIGFERLVIKKTLSAQDFFNGYIIPSPPGTRFTSLDNDINKYVRTKRIPAQSAI